MNEHILFKRIKQLAEILNETKGTQSEHLNKLLTSMIEKYKDDIGIKSVNYQYYQDPVPESPTRESLDLLFSPEKRNVPKEKPQDAHNSQTMNVSAKNQDKSLPPRPAPPPPPPPVNRNLDVPKPPPPADLQWKDKGCV